MKIISILLVSFFLFSCINTKKETINPKEFSIKKINIFETEDYDSNFPKYPFLGCTFEEFPLYHLQICSFCNTCLPRKKIFKDEDLSSKLKDFEDAKKKWEKKHNVKVYGAYSIYNFSNKDKDKLLKTFKRNKCKECFEKSKLINPYSKDVVFIKNDKELEKVRTNDYFNSISMQGFIVQIHLLDKHLLNSDQINERYNQLMKFEFTDIFGIKI